jgi:two-component system, OmpR family, sensor kinase
MPHAQDVYAMGDLDTLAIALRNLLENAVRHAEHGVVDIVVEAPATMRVRDGGPGVPVESLQSIRLKHVRVSANVAGHGLGLSIVSTIVEKQGGELILYSPPTGQTQGFEACIRLREAPHRDHEA